MNRRITPAASGLTSAACYLAALHTADLPEASYSDERVLSLLSDDASRTAIVVSGALLTLGAVAAIPLLAAFADRVQRARPDRSLWLVTFAAGLLYLGQVLVGAQFLSGYALGVAVGEVPVPSEPTLVRVLSDHGFGTLLTGGLAAAGVMVLSVCLAGDAVLPRWLRRVGYVVAGTCLLGPLWIPQFLVVLWLAAGGMLLRNPPSVAPAQALLSPAAAA